MAGNYGKYIDRSPVICAAGKPLGVVGGNTVASTLKEYSIEDQITAIKHDSGIWADNVFKPPKELPPVNNPEFRGVNTEIKPLMNPPVKSRYQTLIEDLMETPYDSYWNKNIGKVRDPVPGLPIGMSTAEVTFGKPSQKGPSMRELINPPKSTYEVLCESQVGHELYKRTHNDYNASEKINRGYTTPPFDKEKCYGHKTKYDPRGIWVRCACNWHIKEPVVHANRIQADYYDRVKPQLGKVLAPNKNIAFLPKGHTFGDPTKRALYGVEELLKDPGSEPCLFKRDFYSWISSLNKFRLQMRARSKEDFNFDDFYKSCLYFDKEKTGMLPIDPFYKLCSCNRITFIKDDIESLLKLLNIIVDDKVNYKKFLDLINMNNSSPSIQLKAFNDIPEKNLHYVTTSQAANCDYLIIDNSGLPTAGIESTQTTTRFCEDTSVNSLLNPSIYTNYGLSQKDFFVPRSADTIRKLFEKVGYNFTGNTFDNLWHKGLQIDGTGSVCVETFKNLVNEYFIPSKLCIDEADYC